MSEDASVNVGVAEWPSPARSFLEVRRMQTKLHRWAVDDHRRLFDDLYNLVYDPAFLTIAWERVAGNEGAKTAGVDKVTVAKIVADVGVEAYLRGIRDLLKTQMFRPVPVRQVMIPKKSGKLRSLGIPVVTDRVVQAALKLVLEPIFEADFQPCSYGFRPNRRAQDAISEVHHFATKSYGWVLEADIEACFDNIDHAALLERIRCRIKDKRILTLVKAFLHSGVLTTTGMLTETKTGTPQGGIISPLLANIALSVLDDYFMTQWRQEMGTRQQRAYRCRHHLANWRLVRYADDFVIVVKGSQADAEQLLCESADVLAPMGLMLSSEKTRVTNIDEGFDFLGFNVRRMMKPGTRKRYVYTRPSGAAIAAVKQRVKTLTYRSTRRLPDVFLMERIGMVLRGWANYFRYAVAKTIFAAIDYYAWRRITNWLRKKHQIGWPAVRRRYCLPGTWQLVCDGRRFRGAASVPVTRYRYRGYLIPSPWDIGQSVAPG